MSIYSIQRCPDSLIRGVIERDHYLHRWPDPRSLAFGYCLQRDGTSLAPDGRPWGAVVMKKPQHHRQRDLFGESGLPTSWQVLDLARVWVHPLLQVTVPGFNRKGEIVEQSENVFSRMVGMVMRRVQADWLEHHPPVYPQLPYHIEIVLSYCDLRHHDGTGYRASGFQRFGTTQDQTKETYIRRLKRPRWLWQPQQIAMEVCRG